MTLDIAYTPDYLNWKLGKGHPTNPIRAKLATEYLVADLGADSQIIDPAAGHRDRDRVESIHSQAYVAEVLDEGKADDWQGVNFMNGDTALQMFAGTARLVERIIEGRTRVGFNPQGAKHHAQFDHSAGFCVFNDMAWAAEEFTRKGLRPLYIDWDVNAGDGVQNLLKYTETPTLSTGASGVYPYDQDTKDPELYGETHTWHKPEFSFYNWNVARGTGNEGFKWSLDGMEDIVREYKPDVILLAAGADAHAGEHWGLKYTMDGYRAAAKRVASWANEFSKGRVLIGGAGGYQPYTVTPQIWRTVARTIYLDTAK